MIKTTVNTQDLNAILF